MPLTPPITTATTSSHGSAPSTSAAPPAKKAAVTKAAAKKGEISETATTSQACPAAKATGPHAEAGANTHAAASGKKEVRLARRAELKEKFREERLRRKKERAINEGFKNENERNAKNAGYVKSDGSVDVAAFNRYNLERAAKKHGFIKIDGSVDQQSYKFFKNYKFITNAGYFKTDGSADYTRYNRYLKFKKKNGELFGSNKPELMYTEYVMSNYVLPAPPTPSIYQTEEPGPPLTSSEKRFVDPRRRYLHYVAPPQNAIDDVVQQLHDEATTSALPAGQDEVDQAPGPSTSTASTPKVSRKI